MWQQQSAYTLIDETTVRQYVGLSSDIKPREHGVFRRVDGSTYLEVDTGRRYVWFRQSWWHVNPDSSVDILAQMLGELQALREDLAALRTDRTEERSM